MYKREDLEKMKVEDIRGLVRKHNLHTNYIKGYSKLRKSDLIDKFLEHQDKIGETQKSKKKTGGRPKLTAFDRAMGLDKPLYPEAKNLTEGAKKQFEARYGKGMSDDAKFLKELYEKMQKEKGIGKRHKKLPSTLKDFVVEQPKKTTKEKPKMGRGQRKKKPTKKFGE